MASRRGPDPGVGNGLARLTGDVVLIRQVAGEIGHVKGNCLGVIVGLNGFHPGVVHFLGAVHRHAPALEAAAALQKEMVLVWCSCTGNLPVADPGWPVTGPGPLRRNRRSRRERTMPVTCSSRLAGQEVLGEQALAGTKAEEGLLSLLPPGAGRG